MAFGGSSARDQFEKIVDTESIPGEEPTTENDQRGLMMRALRQIEGDFAEQTWNAFFRSVIDGISTETVASELGMTHASVRQARSRVLRRLRTHIGDATEH
jgi:RNA polymerase sigma-70 factor (ECF subfamily)